MKRFIPILFLTGCFAEPDPVDDMNEPVGDESSDTTDGDTGDDDSSTGDDPESSTGSLMPSLECPDDVVCVAFVVGNSTLPASIDEYDYPCPAAPIELAWLDGVDVMRTTTVACDTTPEVLEFDAPPNGYRASVDGCIVEVVDAPRTCDGVPCGWGPEPGETVLFGLIDPRKKDPC